ncbi:farnesol dehydrogenase-like [Periplaneta americana]|uniref:farnesol dehydrogenase-like n=1 Tax=Periplaneta americana TaxID=6978 RepID=UPI0037E70A34
MERWTRRVAVVTGASVGIGACIAADLVKKGMKVAGLARRSEKVEELSKSLASAKGKLYAVKCDVTKESEVKEAFKWVKSNLGVVDVLINNAGVLILGNIKESSPDDWRKVFDLNVLGLSMCTKEALQLMKEKGVDDGHIVHINSICGHTPPSPTSVMYYASKHAVTALTEGLRRELVNQKSKIRVTSVSPGLVKTDMPPKQCFETLPFLNPEDVSNSVLYVLGAPPHVQIHELIILPVGAP